jgi:formate hydrogenlyase subunit 3/multisubunit Na+/H+ antiporter MnhD subunit
MEYMILPLAVALIISAFIPSNDEEHVIKAIILIILLGFFTLFVYLFGCNNGIKDGAYNQLRGKYDVTYVIDKDSCVIDTVINFN